MAEKIEVDDESWSEVIVTLAISTATTKPTRTPPPLLRHSIFEWMYLSNDPDYVEYADLAHMGDVIKEKRRQRSPQKKGFICWGGSRASRAKESGHGRHGSSAGHIVSAYEEKTEFD